MLAQILAGALALVHKLGPATTLFLVLAALYGLYVVKMHLGIDIFPNWGLHLLGPRSFIRALMRLVNG